MDDTFTTLDTAVAAAALGAGLVTGVWFAFSGFVMVALDALPSRSAVAAMQAINRSAVTAPLMVALFGTAAVCAGLAVWALLHLGDPRAPWLLAGCGLYLGGAVVVTAAANVPLNDALATLRLDADDIAARWDGYVGSWTAWNHVRALTGVAATAALIVGLTRAPAPA